MTRKRVASKNSADKREWAITRSLFLGESVVASVRCSIESWHDTKRSYYWPAFMARLGPRGPLHPLAVY